MNNRNRLGLVVLVMGAVACLAASSVPAQRLSRCEYRCSIAAGLVTCLEIAEPCDHWNGVHGPITLQESWLSATRPAPKPDPKLIVVDAANVPISEDPTPIGAPMEAPGSQPN